MSRSIGFTAALLLVGAIDARDSTFKDAGKFGVWTKADSIIQFDDLTAMRK